MMGSRMYVCILSSSNQFHNSMRTDDRRARPGDKAHFKSDSREIFNDRFARCRHLTTTTTIPFVCFYYLDFEAPVGFK